MVQRKKWGGDGAVDPLEYGMKGISGQQTRLYTPKKIVDSYKYFKVSKKPSNFWKDGTTQALTPIPEANTWYETEDYPCDSYWNMQYSSNADFYITFSDGSSGKAVYTLDQSPILAGTYTFAHDYDNVVCIVQAISSTGYTPTLTLAVNLSAGNYEVLLDGSATPLQDLGGRLKTFVYVLHNVKAGDTISKASGNTVPIFTLIQ